MKKLSIKLKSSRIVIGFCGVVILVCTLVLVGWWQDIPELKSILPQYITMKANTAFGLSFFTAALWLHVTNHPHRRRRQILAFAIGSLTALIGAVTLLEYLFDTNLGIDELVFRDLGARGKFPPGRLAPITGVNFVLMGVAIVIQNNLRHPMHRTAQSLYFVSFVLSFQAFVGYLVGISYSFGSAFYTQMAVHTALAFILSSCAALLAHNQKGWMEILSADSRGGQMARRLIASSILVPPLVNWLHMVGLRTGLYDADFGTLLKVIGNVVFFSIIVWRNAAILHRTDSELQESLEHRSQAMAAEKSAHQASKMKSDFLATMSHEIRTPISGVIGMSTLLAETALTEEQSDYVRNIQRSSEYLLAIINDILDFSKVEAGSLELERIEFDLDQLVSDIGKTTSLLASSKGLNFSIDSPKDQTHHLLGDPGRLRQILLNLLSNAVKFTPASGKVELRITAHLGALTPNFRFEISDSGVGIRKQALQRIFEPFAQADSSTSRKFGGTGLGLSICKKLVQLMGGELGVESQVAEGSTFWFTLPFEFGSMRSTTFGGPANQFETDVSLSHFRVLVAEDNVINQKVASGMLSKIGCKSLVVGNGHEVLKALQDNPYDLILMDCQMPEMDGYDTTVAVRSSNEAWRNIPIIAMTANTFHGDKERCLSVGMNDYLAKPIRPRELVETLSRFQIGVHALPARSGSHESRESAIDQKTFQGLKELASGNQEGFVVELFELFLESLPSKVKAIQDAWEGHDLKTVFLEAHSLKSAAGTLGGTRLASICQSLEAQASKAEAASPQARSELQELVCRLTKESKALEASIRDLIGAMKQKKTA